MFSAIFSKTGKGGTFLTQATLAQAADSRSSVLTGTAYLSDMKLNQKKGWLMPRREFEPRIYNIRQKKKQVRLRTRSDKPQAWNLLNESKPEEQVCNNEDTDELWDSGRS
jgi:hypothetical protein